MKKNKIKYDFDYPLSENYPTIYKPTNDDWHSNYENNTVALMYIGKLMDGTFRVLVTGNDDTGFEYDYKTEEEAISVFERLSKYPLINYADVEHLGFRHK